MQNSFALDKLLFLKAIGYKFIDHSSLNLAQNFIFQNLDELKKEISSCSLCYLKNGSDSAFAGDGEIGAKILLISFSSSQIKNETEAIKSGLNLSKDEFYASCILRCENDKNTPNECVQMCKPYLFQEINLLKPKLIITLGANTLFSLMPELKNSDINAIRGSLLKFANTNLIPTFSPAWLSKNPSFKADFQNDLKKIKTML
ncbi:uracil-DNA glycosylase family protein [Campylobacter sp. 9BO]|uniref:uracil-DNA glycosylase family protein n=1 Tax=Campylobacter sp. 9BO TaxID=3424759 RepID=UPI003D32F80E